MIAIGVLLLEALCQLGYNGAWPSTVSQVRESLHKNDDLVEQVQLIDANPTCANVRYADGREGTVSIKDLAPCPVGALAKELNISDAKLPKKMEMINCPDNAELQIPPNSQISSKSSDVTEICNEEETGQASKDSQTIYLRRSTRTTRGIPPVRYGTTFSHWG